jgi:HD-like signal output (HDOD) protein
MSSPQRYPSPEHLIQQMKALPSSLHSMQRAMQLLEDPNSSLDDLVDLIRLERSLAAKVIHMANSAAYVGEPCDSIDQAVQRLGYAVVQDAAMALMAIEVFPGPLRLYGYPPQIIWRHSLAMACAMRELARLRQEDTARAYALGLLHNIGMVLIDNWVMKRQPEARLERQDWPDEWQSAELSLMGFDHAEATAEVMQTLNFPAAMVEAARFQCRPEGARNAYRMAALLQMARWIRRQICGGSESCPLPEPNLLREQGMRISDLIEITQRVTVELDTLWNRLGLGQRRVA